MVWGTADQLFPAVWADRLGRTLPQSRGVRLVEGGKLFFPEEMPDVIAAEARRLWGIDRRPAAASVPAAFALSHAADPCVYADMHRTDQHVDLIRRLFAAIERLDREQFAACLHFNREFSWPPSLPYGGTVAASAPGPGWLDTWAPLQPTEVERAMSPQVVAAARDVIVVRWHRRGRNAAGDVIDTPVSSSYTIEVGRLKHAEVFYFDLPAVHLFQDVSRRDG